MDIQNNNVTIQINATDQSGKKLRLSDTDVFIVHVFTDDPKYYLTFSKRDMLMTEFVDELTIPKHQMEQLKSGVVQYTYHYLPVAHDCKYEEAENEQFDEEAAYRPHRPHHHHHTHLQEDLIHSKPVVTSIYWRNIAHPHPEHPINSVTLFDVERLHRLIEKERIDREKDVETLQAQFGEGFSDRLDSEIERSTTQDELHNSMLLNIQKEITDIQKDNETNKDNTDKELNTNATDIVNETARATQKEIELEQLIQGEVSRAKSVEEVIDTKIVMEKERAIANESNINDRLVSLTDRFDAFKELNTETLKSEIERAKATESALNDKIQGVIGDLASEVSRAAQKDIEHTNLVVTESNRAQAVENKIATDLETEITRAKDAEKHILDEVHGVQDVVANLATATNVYTKAEVDTKITGVKTDVATIENWVANHTTDVSALNVKVNAISADVDKAKSDILAEVAKCDAQNGKLATDIQTLTDSTYTKAETDNKIGVVDSSLAEIKNWVENHKDNTEGLNDKVTKLIADTEQLTIDLANETNERGLGDTSLNAKLTITEGKVDAEVDRAKASEKLIADELADFKANVTTRHSDIETAIAGVNADLTLEVARAKAAEKVNADAIEIINGDVSTAGSIKKSLADGKAYTDAEIAKLSLAKDVELADTLKSYPTVSEVDKKISDVIGTAPEALDTLGKISSVLASDSDAITAINGILSGKADASTVYTKSEIDTKVNDVNNTLSALETKSDNADATLNSRIDDLITKVNGVESNIATDSSTLNAKVDAEIARAKSAEKTNADNLTSEIQKVTDKVNELNAKVIEDIANSTAKDTEIDANISAIQTLLGNVEAKIDTEVVRATTKDNELVAVDASIAAKVQANSEAIASEVARSKQVETELNDKINSLNLSETNTNLSAEIDRATAAETTLQSNIDAEVTRATSAEKVISDKVDTEKTRAENAEKVLSDRIDSLDLAAANSSISALNDKIDAEVTRAKAAEKVNSDAIKVNADNLTAEISRAKDAEKALDDKISAIDLTPIRNDVSTLNTKIDNAQTTLQTNIDAESTRAQVAEKVNADGITSLLTSVSGITDSIATVSANLTQLQADSQAKDSEIETAIANEKTRAEAVEATLSGKIDTLNGDSSTVGSLAHVLHDAEHYTDDEVAKVVSALDIFKAESDSKYLTEHQDISHLATADSVYTKVYVDALVDVVNEKINSKLPIDSFNTWSAGVAMKSDVYTKAEVDTLIANVDMTEQLKDYVTTTSLNDAVNQAVADSEQFVNLQTSLDASIVAESERAKAAEKEITDSIETISGIVEQAVEDLNSLFDTSIGEGGNIQIVTKDELDSLLDDYYTKDEITQVMSDMVTKDEASNFLRGVPMSADEYAALEEAGEINENVLYIII